MADIPLLLARRGRGLGALVAILIAYPIPTLLVIAATIGSWFGGKQLIEQRTAHLPSPAKEKRREKLSGYLGGILAIVIGAVVFFVASQTLW